MGYENGVGNGNSGASAPEDVRELTHDELLGLAGAEAEGILGVPLEEAFEMLDRGDLHGTAAEAEFSMLRHLIAS